MKAGTRVLIKAGLGLYNLGIATAVQGNEATILLDKGTTQTSTLDRVIPILYFEKFIPKSVDKEWFRAHEKLIKPIDFDIRSFFLMKKAQVCTIPLMTCMFYWANKYIWQDKLTLCNLGTATRKGASGIYKPKENYLGVSNKTNNTVFDIFDTFLHECCHLWQFTVAIKTGEFNPKAGAHGKTFQQWAGPLKEIAGVKLTVTHDLDSIEVDEAEAGDDKKPGMFIIIAVIPSKGKTYYRIAKSDKLENIAAARTALRSEFGMTAKYYTRTLNNPALLNLIANCKTGGGAASGKISGFHFSSVNEKTFAAINAIAKPIES
jgi:hypothetical protein